MHGNFINRTGKVYGQLTVLGFAGIRRDRAGWKCRAYWKCRCSCGNEIIVQGAGLQSGHTTTCRKRPNHTEHHPDGTTTIYMHRKSGDVLECVIDTSDYPFVKDYRWHAMFSPNGERAYAATGGCPKILMHSLLLPDAEEVDHKDHNGLNNRRDNLRTASRTQNNRNTRKRANTSSQFKGVTWIKHAQKWTAYIYANGKRLHLGRYENEETAAITYDLAAIKYFGEFAYLNILRNPYLGEVPCEVAA